MDTNGMTAEKVDLVQLFKLIKNTINIISEFPSERILINNLWFQERLQMPVLLVVIFFSILIVLLMMILLSILIMHTFNKYFQVYYKPPITTLNKKF